tara:strand:- start:5767 stop:6453 length:687 start_codon:yes stop_codon:yes gene_type:complete
MLILYNFSLKKKNLINIIKINKLEKYSKLNKKDLINLINRKKAVICIQKFIRSKFNDEDICPITLDKLKYPFVSIKNYNKFRYYSLTEFIEYLNKSSSEFKDPFTREILSDKSLKQIENLIKYYKIKSTHNKKTWKRMKFIRAEFLTITNCLNEILNQIFSVSTLHFYFIYNNILPQFIYYFHFLLQRHKNQCYSLINNYINCINYHSCENKIYLVDYLKLIIDVNNL